MDDTDPMVSVMKLEKAPEETYADIGGLDTQIQEIKVVMYICTHRTHVLVQLCDIKQWVTKQRQGFMKKTYIK